MGYIFIVYLVYSNLNSIFIILNVIMTKYQILASKHTQRNWTVDFLKILAIWTSFSYKQFVMKERLYLD